MAMKLQNRAEQLASRVFLGGPAASFEAIGRLQLITLLRCGLDPDSKLLDLGCGTLRGGYWIVNFLRPDCYFGIEPNLEMLEVGRSEILGPELLAEKRPRFLSNDRFDPTDFGVRFDFFLARSIWTHASRAQIEAMLDAFVAHGARDALFLTSYLPARRGRKGHTKDVWVGRSHRSDQRGVVEHDSGWIEAQCRQRDLGLDRLDVDNRRQPWLLISKGAGAVPIRSYLRDLLRDDSRPRGWLAGLRGFLKGAGRRIVGSARSG